MSVCVKSENLAAKLKAENSFSDTFPSPFFAWTFFASTPIIMTGTPLFSTFSITTFHNKMAAVYGKESSKQELQRYPLLLSQLAVNLLPKICLQNQQIFPTPVNLAFHNFDSMSVPW